MRSVLTALSVFEAVADAQPVGVGALARALDLPKSTVQRCLRTLWFAGWIRPDDSEVTKWILTSRVRYFAEKAIPDMSVRDAAIAVMHELRRATTETIHLMVREGDRTVLIESVETSHPVRTFTQIGTAVPLHGSSTGKAMLSRMPEAEVRQILGPELQRYTSATVVDWDVFLSELRVIVERGYATNNREWHDDIAAVAAPILDKTGAPVAALSISTPASRMTAELVPHYGELVHEAGARVSAALGYRTSAPDTRD